MNHNAKDAFPGLGFWNLAMLSVFGYGGVVMLFASLFDFQTFAHISTASLATLLVSGGTLGLFMFKKIFAKRDNWPDAVAVAFSLNLVCAGNAWNLGNTPLIEFIATVAAFEVLMVACDSRAPE